MRRGIRRLNGRKIRRLLGRIKAVRCLLFWTDTNQMILIGLIEWLDSIGDELTIYAEKNPDWSANSLAIVCPEPEDGGVPDEARGMSYLLTVFLAREVIQDWGEGHGGRGATAQDRCEAVIYYAENSTYLPG
jgi:hypothetical protein